MEYLPTRTWRVVNALGDGFIVLAGIGMGVAAVDAGQLWLVLPAVAILVLGIVALVRLPRAAIRYDMSRLVVVGLLWSRVIPRAQIESVDAEPNNAWVVWRTRGGRLVFTPLTLLWGNRFGSLPDKALKRGRRYLRRVRLWAGVHGN